MRKIKLLAVLMALSFWVVSPVLAQTSPPNQPADSGSGVVEVISTININSAAIISQSGSDLKIAFNLTGGKQIQPDLKYGVFLVVPGNGENIVADQKIYPETLVLAANSTIHKEITYTIPAWISGNFDVWVKVENSKGVLMSQDMAGNIKRNGQTDNFINIDSSSCSLQVDGTGQKYTLDQSPPVIAPSENLILTCDIKNNYGHNMTVIPNFVTHSQSLFGQIVSTNKQADLALAANTSKTATFTLPKAVVPQDYDMLFTLIDSQGQTVSNTLDVRYAIAGIIGVIQNFRIDKNSYAQGDAIQASFSWDIRQTNSVNAPEKEGMEGTGIYTDNGSASIAIASDGKTCISPFEKKLSDIATGPNSADIKFPVVANCPNPAVTVTLKDANGNVLDKLDFSTAKTAAGKTQPTGNTSNHNNTLLVLVVLLVTLAVILLIVIAHKKNWKNITRIGLFLVIIFLSGFWVKGSQADTIDLNFVHQSLDSNWKLYTAYTPIFNVTFDVAPQYNANEKIDVVVEAHNVGSDDDDDDNSSKLMLTGTTNGTTYTYYDQYIADRDYWANDGNFTVPQTPGTYPITFNYKVHSSNEDNLWTFSGSYTMYYTVIDPAVPGVCGSDNNKTLASTPTNLCSTGTASTVTGTGPWTWTCDGSGGGITDSCRANLASTVVDGACGSADGKTLSSAPADPDLCQSPSPIMTASPDPLTSPWKWTCHGSNGGADSPQCSASLSAPGTYSLNVYKSGQTGGSITSASQPSLNCASGCSYSSVSGLTAGTSVTDIAASGNASIQFKSWSGCDSTSGTGGNICQMNNIQSTKNVTATFSSIAVGCTSDCSCKASTCIGSTCADAGCIGQTCNGEKNCSNNGWKEVAP